MFLTTCIGSSKQELPLRECRSPIIFYRKCAVQLNVRQLRKFAAASKISRSILYHRLPPKRCVRNGTTGDRCRRFSRPRGSFRHSPLSTMPGSLIRSIGRFKRSFHPRYRGHAGITAIRTSFRDYLGPGKGGCRRFHGYTHYSLSPRAAY